MKWLKIAGLALLLLVLIIFAVMGYQYATQGTPTKAVRSVVDTAAAPAIGDPAFLRSVALLTKTPLAAGHRIEPLFNGDATYPRLWQDLRSAQHSITLQLYYCKPGALADSLKNILIDRVGHGVAAYLLLDAFGAQDLTDPYLDSLRSAGVRVASFRPLQWYALNKAQHRSHIRVVVVDGRIGYTGGFGLADFWQGSGRARNEWRETNVRFSGPAVNQLQAAFYDGWAEATGELLAGQHAFPQTADSAARQIAGLLHAEPVIGSTAAERFISLTITGARRSLYITNAYFVPDDDFRRMLRAAARRGVDVRILTAGEETDVKLVRLASRHSYGELMRDGVRIYEYRPTMLHAKTMVADGQWSTIGTMNFDNRSLALNDESNLIVQDTAIAAVLVGKFADDLRHADEIRPAEFARRSIFARLLEGTVARLARLL